MNDVKELCELTLDVPAPPMRDATDALALARRSARTRDGLATAAASVAIVAAAALVAAPVLMAAGPAAVAPATQAAVAPAVVARKAAPAPPVPAWKAAQANGARVTQLLLDAVPAGYRAAPEYTFTDASHTSTWLQQSVSNGLYTSMTSVVVSAGQRQGLLQAFVTKDGTAAPTGDLCGAEVTARVDRFFGTGTHCQVTDVGGVPVRVSTRTDHDLGVVTIAVRMLAGGMAAVQATQHRFVFDNGQTSLPPDAASHPATQPATAPGLIAPAFTADQVAAVAADPAMLP